MKRKEPLAQKLRPTELNQIIGQEHLLEDDNILNMMIYTEMYESMVFYGPPGVGKTTIAAVVAKEISKSYQNTKIHHLNATLSSIQEVRNAINDSEFNNVIIMEEIHRMNKDKQDILLEGLERGDFTLIGTTTSNPDYALNKAIRSRVVLIPLKPVSENEIENHLNNILLNHYPEYNYESSVPKLIAQRSSGDVRYSISALERCIILASKTKEINLDVFEKALIEPNRLIDKNEDGYHTMLSSLQKSIRGYDVQASLYYLGQLLNVGDMVSLERRLIAIAYEDVGLANPELCARVAVATDAAKRIGMPEAALVLSTVVIEMATSKHSRSAHDSIHKVLSDLDKNYYESPEYLKLKVYGRHRSEEYDYSNPELWRRLAYLPEQIKDVVFYTPENNDIIGNENQELNRTYDILSVKKEILKSGGKK